MQNFLSERGCVSFLECLILDTLRPESGMIHQGQADFPIQNIWFNRCSVSHPESFIWDGLRLLSKRD